MLARTGYYVRLWLFVVSSFSLAFCLHSLLQTPHTVTQEYNHHAHPTVSTRSRQCAPKNVTWRQIFTDFYISSVYPTVGFATTVELHFVILGSAKVWTRADTNCTCLYYTPQHNDSASEEGILELLPESHWEDGHNMAAGRLRCKLPATDTNKTSLRVHCEQGNLSGTVTYSMPVVTDKEPANLTFAHCGLIYGLYNENQAAVVEFIEYYRLMGVSKFFWNGMEIGERTMEVLRYYEKEGIMQLSNWILPFNQTSGKSVHYHGQVAMQYDCILKTAAHYDYTVISDLDEYFATSLQPPTFASIVHNGSSDCATVRSAFMEPTANYNDTFEPQSGLPMLRTSRITNRSSEVHFYGQRSKYICRMRTVPAGLSMIHFAMSHKNDGTGKNIAVNDDAPSEETILLHFRREESEKDIATVPDERAADLAPQLRERVIQTWKEMSDDFTRHSLGG